MSETTTATTTTTPDPTTTTPPSPSEQPHSPDWVGDFLKATPAPEGTAASTAAPQSEATPTPTVETKAETNAEEKPKAETKPTPSEDAKKDKQIKDTRDAFAQERQANIELRRQLSDVNAKLEILTKKIDGTYEEPAKPAPEEQTRQASLMARVDASYVAAVERYGEAEIQQLVMAPDAPFRELEKDPAINARVLSAKLPVVEAYKVVKEAAAKQKYGGGDVDAMVSAIKAELIPELTKKIQAELLVELRGKQQEEVRGLGGVPSNGTREPATGSPSPDAQLSSLFPLFTPTAG